VSLMHLTVKSKGPVGSGAGKDSVHKIERVNVSGCIWMISSELAGGEKGGGGVLSSGKPL